MAVGDINSREVQNWGNQKVITGTIEVSQVATAFPISGTASVAGSRISWCLVQDIDGMGALQCTPNSNNGTVDSHLGSIWVDNATTETVTVQYVCAISA